MLTDARVAELPEWLRDLYPFRTRTVQVADCRLSFVDEGPPHAPAVVLLHGNPTWSFLYRNTIQRLSPEYRVIAPDHVGFGLSDKPADPAYHTLARHIANFTELVEALQLRDFTLVAHGWGGPIGLGYATAFPGNVARLVLVNTWACNLPNLHRIKLPWRLRFAASGRMGTFFDNLLNLSMHATFNSRTYRPLSDWALEAYTYPFATRASRVAISAFTQMFFKPDAATRARLAEIQAGLQRIEARAEILWGMRDPVLTRLAAYLLRDDLRHAAEPTFFPDASHYLPEDLPDALPDVLLRPSAAAPSAAQEPMFKIL
jgi:pimeloyl-ACP methyl ester carboxylesterase